jgi:heat shock protein HslJ
MLKLYTLLFLCVACNSSKIQTQKNSQNIEGKWQLIEFRGLSIKSSNFQLVLNIQTNNNLYFKGICNEITGKWGNNPALQISFNNLAITEEVCDTVHYDHSIYEMFTQINNFAIQNDTLSLNKFKMAPQSKWIKIAE